MKLSNVLAVLAAHGMFERIESLQVGEVQFSLARYVPPAAAPTELPKPTASGYDDETLFASSG